MVVCVRSTSRHPAHPVSSVLILHPRETLALW